MKITYLMIMMFFGSFIIQYLLMPPIMVNNTAYITNNLGKLYLSTIMGIYMVLLTVVMRDHQYHTLSVNWYIILISLLSLFIYLYRYQKGINDKQYLAGMIEHHSMALHTSEEILKKTDNYYVAKLAKDIISQQKDELRTMIEFVKK